MWLLKAGICSHQYRSVYISISLQGAILKRQGKSEQIGGMFYNYRFRMAFSLQEAVLVLFRTFQIFIACLAVEKTPSTYSLIV